MPSVTTIIRLRRKTLLQGRSLQRAALSFSLVFSLIAASLAMGTALAYANLTRDLPSIEMIPQWLEPPEGILLQPTRFYDRTAEHIIYTLESQAIAQRKYLYFPSSTTLSETRSASDFLPANLVAAILVTFDPDFWEQPTVTLQDLWRRNTSTLAQRFVSELLFTHEKPGIKRTFQEQILANQLVKRYGQGKVIEWFLNSAPFGSGVYGADAASWYYFGKPASSLRLAEAAFLAAMAEKPELDPRLSKDMLLQRQKEILQAMLQYQWVQPDEGTQAIQEEVSLSPHVQADSGLLEGRAEEGISPAYLALVVQQLAETMPISVLQRGGYRVITTLDLNLQHELACTLSYQLARVNNLPIPEFRTPCNANRLLPSLVRKSTFSEAAIHGEALILDVQRGQILALATQAKEAPGSASLRSHPVGTMMTPFIYLIAFTRGMAPASLVWDVPPTNEELGHLPQFGTPYKGPVRLRIALANDYLMPAIQVSQRVGVENIWSMVQQFGMFPWEDIQVNQSREPMALFEAETSLLSLAKGYAIIANQGTLAGVYPGEQQDRQTSWQESRTTLQNLPSLPVVLRVERAPGEIVASWERTDSRPMITPQLAYLVHHILSDESARWPSMGHPNPLEIGQPAAVKMGTTLKGEGAWVIGYLPQLLAGVWIGAESAASLPAETQELVRDAAAGFWHAIMQYSSAGVSPQEWKIPPGIIRVQVCDPSGMLPTAACPNVVSEIFIEGNEPTHEDTLYQLVPINRSNQKLATIFTPPELIREQAFLSIPPEAEDWAKQAGIELPPSDYDPIPAELPVYPEAHISAPKMFAFVRGTVSIIGSAGGAGFDSYILQYGAGLNPQGWFTIAESSHAVDDGLLATWDTSGLDGLYVLQLLVVRDDRSVQRANLCLTVDNIPPQVSIVYPYHGSTIDASIERQITFSVQVDDNLGIQRVSLILDGEALIELDQPPYAFTWRATKGKHQFRARVTDMAGNTNEAQIEFMVE